jgi:hypothetical protein
VTENKQVLDFAKQDPNAADERHEAGHSGERHHCEAALNEDRSMRHLITSLLLAGSVSSAAVAFQASSGGAAPATVCPLLTRDLVMKVSTTAGRSALERAKPIEDWVTQESKEAGLPVRPGVSSCKYGRVLLVFNPLARPDQVRNAMRARTTPYTNYEPVSGVGDAAFFEANSAYANLYVWSGSRHFHIEMGAGLDDDAKAMKPNTIALANAIIAQLK